MNKTFARASDIARRFRAALGEKPLAETKDGRGKLYIYKPIGDMWFTDCVSASQVAEQLDAMATAGVTALDVYVNSEGGSVWDGKTIYELIARFAGEKTVHIDGLAASAASFICMAGDKIVCSPAGTVMIHRAWTGCAGNAEQLRTTADILDMEDGSIAGIYARRTGRPVDEINALLRAETWMNAAKAKELGFCDEIRGDEGGDGSDAQDAARTSPVMALMASTEERIRQNVAAVLAAQKKTLAQHARGPAPGASTTPQRPAARK